MVSLLNVVRYLFSCTLVSAAIFAVIAAIVTNRTSHESHKAALAAGEGAEALRWAAGAAGVRLTQPTPLQTVHAHVVDDTSWLVGTLIKRCRMLD